MVRESLNHVYISLSSLKTTAIFTEKMKECSNCPICHEGNLKIIGSNTYSPSPIHLLPKNKLPNTFNSRDERLWIFFNYIVRQDYPFTFEMQQCLNCGFIFTNPRLDKSDINTKYQVLKELGLDSARHQQNPPKKVDQRSLRVYQLFQSTLAKDNRGSKLDILDYGGAEGFLLNRFCDEGHDGYLVDFMKYAKADPRIKYLGKELSDIPHEKKFDFILLLHTLEHVVDPVGLIKQLKDHLKSNGKLYIEVPLGAWMEWKYLKEPITHLNFFSEQSLAQVFKEAGLDVSKVETKWQWTTHSSTPCINMVGGKTKPKIKQKIQPTNNQKKTFYFFQKPLRENPRYFGKLFLKSLLGQLIN
jgi:2-polyprenyl-3-methyl-5-hydroxy-6-metoxy-1,4-benzoquinol methylase